MPSSATFKKSKGRSQSPDALIMSVDTMQGRRKYPVTHPAMEAPCCCNCAAYGLCFFDLDCEGCLEVVHGPDVSVGQLFAVLRQWTRPVQIQLETLVEQMFAQGANVNDRDGLTDMTLLHYAAKSGAQGEESLAQRIVGYLLDEGAVLEARCKWTDMTPLHYAVYFDVASAVELLLDRGADVRATCSELCRGGALHIAAAQLALDSARVLVRRGADRIMRDARGRTPHDCLPSVNELPENLTTLRNHLSILLCPTTPPGCLPSELQFNPNKIRPPEMGVLTPPIARVPHPPTPLPMLTYKLVDMSNEDERDVANHYHHRGGSSSRENSPLAVPQEDELPPSPRLPINTPPARDSPIRQRTLLPQQQMHSPGRVSAKVTLQAIGMTLGDRVVISAGSSNAGDKKGVLRYCGPVEFADGVWAGVEVVRGQGRNDGSVDGVRYFSCGIDTEGVFCPVTRIKLYRDAVSRRPGTPRHALDNTNRSIVVHRGTIDVSGVEARVDTGLDRTTHQIHVRNLSLGDRVLVAGQRKGTILFIGPTEFGNGDSNIIWYGIELDKPVGRNDGAVNGVRYFTCPTNCGVFAPASRLQKLRPRRRVSQSRTEVGTKDHQQSEQRHSTLMTTSQTEELSTLSNSPISKESMLSASNSTVASNTLMTTSAIVSNTPTYFGDASGSIYLREGLQVLCNNELGVVRYVGHTDFSDGLWVGVELRHATGKNDGEVRGRRYFACAPGHGLLVRPSRVSVRGISGAHLIPPELLTVISNNEKTNSISRNANA